jgi:hypothetical protein
MASKMKSRFAEYFPHGNPGFGTRTYKSITFRNIQDARSPTQVIPKRSYHFRGDDIGTLDFLLVVRNTAAERYYGRYLNTLMRIEWGKRRPFGSFSCIACDVPSLESARRSVGRTLSFM